MALDPSQMLEKILVGNDAGWIMTFHETNRGHVNEEATFEIGRDDYYAEIQATLPGGLEGGSYNFIIEGILDSDYQEIKRAQANGHALKLHLFWRDVSASLGGYLTSTAGLTDVLKDTAGKADPSALVAVLAITNVRRRVGSRRYEAVITAREWVYDRLDGLRLCHDTLMRRVENQILLEGAEALVQDIELPKEMIPFDGLTEKVVSLERGTKLSDVLARIGRRVEELTDNHGRGMYLIRNGKLYIGQRGFPLRGDDDKFRLTAAAGLVECESQTSFVSNPNHDFCQDQPGSATGTSTDQLISSVSALVDTISSLAGESGPGNPPPSPYSRPAYRLVLKGRPDIKPGSIVEFTPPREDQPPATASVLGGVMDLAMTIGGAFTGGLLAGLNEFDPANHVSMYVSSVEHRLGRTSGFVTTISGVVLADLNDPWDHHTERHIETHDEPPAAQATSAGRTAEAVRYTVRRAVSGLRLTEVGEVRRFHAQDEDESPTQTETVWRGLVRSHGEANQTRRLEIQRPTPSSLEGVPYMTPYAWGKTGLILPRYPGMRILLSHRNGNHDDPVDIGALWGPQYRPENTQPGDYWLILPAAVSTDSRTGISDNETTSSYGGACTQDLIDADGNRIIEVGELTVRITRNALKNAGERPTRPSDQDAVTIEHVDGGAKIVIKSDGSITIQGTKIDLDAGSGDITLKGANVKAEVSGSFDVS